MRRALLTLIVLAMMVVSLLLTVSTVSAAAAWAPNTAYHVGDQVTYAGSLYTCRQAHTSLVGWEPSTTPALWLLAGTEVTATSTLPGPTAVFTPTPTPVSGTCPSPAWSPSAVYTGGMTASHNNHEWRARWWTQGEEPGTTGPWGVWEDRGACSTSSPTPTSTQGASPTPTRTPVNPTPTFTPTSGGPGGGKIIGYFVQWGVYGRNYHVKNIDTSGTAAKLTHINYAFANVVGGKCVSGDTYADYDRFYDAASSVSGVADSWDAGALRGNFHQLQELKAKYPHLKILISLGGWTWSGGFHEAVASPAARETFVKSCVDMYIKGQFGAGLNYPGIFDGIDIDWEYPAACGLSCSPAEDAQNYVAMLQEFRRQLNAAGSGYLLTIAAPAGYDKINVIDWGAAQASLDWINLMSYDFFGAWAATGPTAFHSPLYSWTGIPTPNYTADYAVQLYKSKGVPASKLVLGVGFYGRGWTGVTNANNGLNQPATGAAPGTYEAGIEDYKVLKNFNGTIYRQAGTMWKFNGSTFWSYDDPVAMAEKMNYLKSQGLGGVMFWELSGDTSNGELINALFTNR